MDGINRLENYGTFYILTNLPNIYIYIYTIYLHIHGKKLNFFFSKKKRIRKGSRLLRYFRGSHGKSLIMYSTRITVSVVMKIFVTHRH